MAVWFMFAQQGRALDFLRQCGATRDILLPLAEIR